MARLLLILLLVVPGLAAGEDDTSFQMPQFIGNLTSELHADAPIGLAGGGRVTVRLVNTSGGVLGLARITQPPSNYPTVVRLPAKEAAQPDAVWGPGFGDEIASVRGGITASQHLGAWRAYPGQEAYLKRLRLREGRPPLVLLPREGYGWILEFAAEWLTEDAAKAVHGQHQLVLHPSGGVFSLLLPDKAADAISPGKPLRWGERRDVVTVPKVRSIAVVPGPTPAPVALATLAGPLGAVLLIQADAEAQAGADLPLTYLVGNLSAQPLWVRQNQLTQAWPRWRITDRQGREVATADGALALPLQRLLPERAPFPLLPGELLCWKHLIPASALKDLRPGQSYVLHGSLATPLGSGWTAPETDTASELAATLDIVLAPARR